MIKKLFPFSLNEYLKVLGCYVVFFALSYFFSFIVKSSVSNADVASMTAKSAALMLILVLGMIILNFAVYTFATTLTYLIAAKKKFQIGLWPKYILSLVIMALIFLIPFLFAIRLFMDNNPAAITVFVIVLLVALHFFNLTFLFVALTGKTFQGIRKSFWFGTVKIKHLIVPYLWFIGVSLVLSLFMLLKIEFLNLILSGILISWAVLYIGRTVLSLQHGKKIERFK